MRNLIIIILMLPLLCFAQQGINYKAVIQDGDQVVTNTTITLYFAVIENANTDVYKETHIITTDNNGIVVTNIGEGTPTLGAFQAIDWTKEHYLNVSVDIGNGLENLGTTRFDYVPYALHAKTAEIFTGTIPKTGSLFKVTENRNEGYRLADAEIGNHGDIGEEAIDLSFQSSTSDTRGASASGAFASGYNTEASGEYSVAFGYTTKASDTYATSFGIETEALGYTSTAFGSRTIALGYISSTFGEATTAESYAQTTIGMYNTETIPNQVSSFDYDDRLFVIGNGVNNALRSDALIMLKNGNTELNGALTIDAANDDTGYTLPTTKGTSGQVLTMNEADSGTHWAVPSESQLEKITEGGNTGYRLLGSNPSRHGNIGSGAIDFSYQPFNSELGATGTNSIAVGNETNASGNNSVAMGFGANAEGDNSIAMGYQPAALGSISTVFGAGTQAESYGQTTIGLYNTIASNTNTLSDRLFVIGNGSSTGNRSNALVILKNGNTTINGEVKVEEIQATDSGDADMKAYIYGLVSVSGGISAASSEGFTVERTGTGVYRINFTNPPPSHVSYIAMASLNELGFVTTTRNQAYVLINTYDTSGNADDKNFSFVVYKK